MKKYDKLSGRTFDCFLVDDGTMDTVISINGQWTRFDSENVLRRQDGSIPAAELNRLFEEGIDDLLTNEAETGKRI
jgi:hypothetical protein